MGQGMSASAQIFIIEEAIQLCDKCICPAYCNALTNVVMASSRAPALNICETCLTILKKWSNRHPVCPRDVRNWIGRSPATLRFDFSRTRVARAIQRAYRRRKQEQMMTIMRKSSLTDWLDGPCDDRCDTKSALDWLDE